MKRNDEDWKTAIVCFILVLQVIMMTFIISLDRNMNILNNKLDDKIDCSKIRLEEYNRGYKIGLQNCAVDYCELKLYSDICKRTVRINPDGSKTVTIDSKECPSVFKDEKIVAD